MLYILLITCFFVIPFHSTNPLNLFNHCDNPFNPTRLNNTRAPPLHSVPQINTRRKKNDSLSLPSNSHSRFRFTPPSIMQHKNSTKGTPPSRKSSNARKMCSMDRSWRNQRYLSTPTSTGLFIYRERANNHQILSS